MGIIIGRKRRCSCSAPREDHHLLLLTFFVAILLQKAVVESTTLNYTRHRQTSTLRLERISKHLNKINKPHVLTIEVTLLLLILFMYYSFHCTLISGSDFNGHINVGFFPSLLCVTVSILLYCRVQMEIL